MAETLDQKIARLKAMISSNDDLASLVKEAGIETHNAEKYLYELAANADEQALLDIYGYKQDVEDKYDYRIKEIEVHKIIELIGFGNIPAKYLENEYVASYVARQNSLIAKLDELLTVVVK